MEIEDFVKKLQEWHAHQAGQLQLIVDQEDAVINIGGKEIQPGSDFANGVRFGVILSLELLGKLPFSIKQEGD